MNEEKLSAQIISALKYFLYKFFVYFVFIVPFDLWKKSTKRLVTQKESGRLDISRINSLWPFLSFLKAFILEFFIDGISFISYILAPIIGIISWLNTGEFYLFPVSLAAIYFTPLAMSIIRDILQLLTLPFKKFLSWAAKPAQYMDLEIKNK